MEGTKSIEQNYSQTEPNCRRFHRVSFVSKDSSEQHKSNQQDLNIHRKRFEELAKRLNINPLQAYQIPRTNRFYKHLPFIRKHYGNLQNATKAFYPEHTWSESPLDKTHSRSVQLNHKTRLEEIAKELNIKCLDDWYNVSRTQLYDKAPFIPGTYGSLQHALEAFYPNHSWDVSRFGVKTKNYWNDRVNQKNALERVASELNIKTVEDWYKTSRKRLYIKLPFIQKYYGTLFVALSTLYPEHDWNALKFERAPLGLWNSPNAKVEFKEVIEQLIHKYNIKEYEDWKSIPWNDYRLFQRIAKGVYSNASVMLSSLFPSINWKFHNLISKHEQLIQDMLKEVEEINTQVMINGHSIDIYIPKLKIAIEYQGMQHYKQLNTGHYVAQCERDNAKRLALEQIGIRLVHVPYWWKASWQQLASTIVSRDA